MVVIDRDDKRRIIRKDVVSISCTCVLQSIKEAILKTESIAQNSSLSENPLFAQVVNYENEELVERFKDKLGLDDERARILFKDIMLFLYLCSTRPGSCSPTAPIDAAWHEFILYTKEYEEFCQVMFGRFIHHVPRSYLSESNQTKGNTWRTFKMAEQCFGALSANWDVPEHMRPNRTKGGETVTVLEMGPCDSCGCDAACNH